MKKWTKKCNECGTYFIPDEYEICDSCFIEKYREELGIAETDDWDRRMYEEDKVVKALRKAMRGK